MMKIKIVVMSILCSVGVWGESPSLFGTVINVAQNDTLNVRSSSSYKAKKVGEIPLDAFVGVEKCKRVKKARWCRVYPLVQNMYDTFAPQNAGWVNAQYLKFSNRGYVKIRDEKTNCFYAVKCRSVKDKKECLVVYALNYDYKKDKMIDVKSKWIERKKLKGESAFGAASQNREINPEGGYCTSGSMLDDYLKNKTNK